MAEFCRQCSIELFGKDFGEAARPGKPDPEPGYGWGFLCEGCGFTVVNKEGECIATHCSIHGMEKEHD